MLDVFESNNINNPYFIASRMRSGLTQQDTAFVMGYTSPKTISHLERQMSRPTLKAFIAYQILFDEEPDILLRYEYQAMREMMRMLAIERLCELHKVEQVPTVEQRIRFLESFINPH
ncbi:MAG: helix-turn-helix transcriptional regulator [Pseudomonadota bacterium]